MQIGNRRLTAIRKSAVIALNVVATGQGEFLSDEEKLRIALSIAYRSLPLPLRIVEKKEDFATLRSILANLSMEIVESATARAEDGLRVATISEYPTELTALLQTELALPEGDSHEIESVQARDEKVVQGKASPDKSISSDVHEDDDGLKELPRPAEQLSVSTARKKHFPVYAACGIAIVFLLCAGIVLIIIKHVSGPKPDVAQSQPNIQPRATTSNNFPVPADVAHSQTPLDASKKAVAHNKPIIVRKKLPSRTDESIKLNEPAETPKVKTFAPPSRDDL